MNNENGSTSFMAIVILLILTIGFTSIIKSDLTQIKEQAHLYRGLLCAKEINGRTSRLIRNMNTTNRVLMLLKAGQTISVILPKLKLLTGFLGKATKKSLMSYQVFELNQYRANLARMNRSRCHALPAAYKTPYQAGAIKIRRDKWDRAKRRKKNWKVKTLGGSLLIDSFFDLQKASSKTILRKRIL